MKKMLLLLWASLPLVIYFSCEEDSTSQSTVYIPQIEAGWKAENNDQHSFFFNTEDEGKNSGVFDGNEDLADSSFFGSPLAGSFFNRQIEFTVQRPTGSFKFQGNIVNEGRIELNSPAGALVIVRQ